MLFPTFYAMAESTGASVKEVWMPLTEEGGWSLCFKRPINDWERERVEGLIIVIKDKKINPPKRT